MVSVELKNRQDKAECLSIHVGFKVRLKNAKQM